MPDLDVHAFADLWEHVRLLSDRPRNEALLELLRRRAPGARVLEVGCGTGLLSCVAARLGATHVHAVEPTAQAELARALVAANGLGDRVTVHEAMIEDLDPEPVDLVFSELLNADPFAEGIVSASAAAARWRAPRGHLAPHTLRVHLAALGDDRSAGEVHQARTELQRLATAHGLELGPLLDGLDTLEPYPFLAPTLGRCGPLVEAFALPLGTGDEPPEALDLALPWPHEGPVRAIAVAFAADLDDGLVLANPPGQPGHWGHLVLGLPAPAEADDGVLELTLFVDEGELSVERA